MSDVENPILPIKYASICFHFIDSDKVDLNENNSKLENRESITDLAHDPFFGSMEKDLLAYQFQLHPVLNSTHCTTRKSYELTIIFPSSFRYHTEGRCETLFSEKTRKPIDFMLSKTDFLESRITIWHLTLSASSDDHPLNEFEIIKLTSLFDGRAENTGPYENTGNTNKLANNIRFEYKNENLSIIDLVKKLTNIGCKNIELKSGTIQVLVDDKSMELLSLATKSRYDDSGQAHKSIVELMSDDCPERRKILQALSGIVIGIFDYEEVDSEEILDTFEPSFADSNVFIKFNRGTLISIAKNDRAMETCQNTIGISPYLILPHAVLIHNEKLTELANKEIDSAKEIPVGIANIFDFEYIESAYRNAERYLSSLQLPMIFNYPTEKTLYEQGNIKRGTTEKYKIVRSKLLEMHSRIEGFWQFRRDLGQAIIGILLAFISVMQLPQSNENLDENKLLIAVVVIAVMLIIYYFTLRSHKR